MLAAGSAMCASIPLLSGAGAAGGPVARYDIRAGTTSGMGMGAMGGGGMMGMMFGGGGGNNWQYELLLRLGSSDAPAKGSPRAEHFMPPGAKLGKSVLLTGGGKGEAVDEMPEKPKGRLLLFWGCGAATPKGQPVVIDFAKLAAGQMPPGLWSTTILRDYGPTAENSRTFARWPSEDGKFVKADSSLRGAHRVVSNYAPEIAFTAVNDFMAPLKVTSRQQAGGATVLSWAGIPGATGYLASIMGGKMGPNDQMGDMVMWTSSASRQFGGGLADWLSPAQVAKLVADKTVMPPSATSFVVPVQVTQAAPDFRSGMLTAFGPEENFAYPARPADPQWTARIRHRSTTSWMDGMGMSMSDMEDAENGAPSRNEQPCKRKGGFGGMLGGVLGGSGC